MKKEIDLKKIFSNIYSFLIYFSEWTLFHLDTLAKVLKNIFKIIINSKYFNFTKKIVTGGQKIVCSFWSTKYLFLITNKFKEPRTRSQGQLDYRVFCSHISPIDFSFFSFFLPFLKTASTNVHLIIKFTAQKANSSGSCENRRNIASAAYLRHDSAKIIRTRAIKILDCFY